VEWV
jgi:hypothetical protein